MLAEILVLRLIHIVGGIFWVGSSLFTALFLAPALTTSGVNAGQVFGALQQRRLFTALPLVAVCVILSGMRLMWIASAGSATFFASTPGHAFGAAGGCAILAFAISLVVGRPTAVRSARLGAAVATATDEERPKIMAQLAALRTRGARANALTTALLTLAAVGMSVARYLP
ncbi:MAG: hypothetical protein ABJE47_10250 [bacterium]